MQQIQKPIIGDIIHIVGADSTHWPALVQVVHDTPGVIDAWAFMRHSSGPERRVRYMEPMSTHLEGETLQVSPAEPKTWHWPEVDQPTAQQAPEEVPVMQEVTNG